MTLNPLVITYDTAARDAVLRGTKPEELLTQRERDAIAELIDEYENLGHQQRLLHAQLETILWNAGL